MPLISVYLKPRLKIVALIQLIFEICVSKQVKIQYTGIPQDISYPVVLLVVTFVSPCKFKSTETPVMIPQRSAVPDICILDFKILLAKFIRTHNWKE